MGTGKKVVAAKKVKEEENFEELTTKNIMEMTAILQASSETLDTLTGKVTSLACHVTALEALLSEVIKITGVDLMQVNAIIRSRINSVNGGASDSNAVIDIAAALACPGVKK